MISFRSQSYITLYLIKYCQANWLSDMCASCWLASNENEIEIVESIISDDWQYIRCDNTNSDNNIKNFDSNTIKTSNPMIPHSFERINRLYIFSDNINYFSTKEDSSTFNNYTKDDSKQILCNTRARMPTPTDLDRLDTSENKDSDRENRSEPIYDYAGDVVTTFYMDFIRKNNTEDSGALNENRINNDSDYQPWVCETSFDE